MLDREQLEDLYEEEANDMTVEEEDQQEIEQREKDYRKSLETIALFSKSRKEWDEKIHDIYNANEGRKEYYDIRDDFFEILRKLVYDRVLKLQDIIDDPVRRGIEQTKLEDWLDIFYSRDTRKEVVSEILTGALQPQVYNLREVIEAGGSTEKYHIQELFPYGRLFLLVAAPKTGKSLFLTKMVLSTITGNPFLGRECQKAKILYIQNEEAVEDTGQKLDSNGLQLLRLRDPETYNTLLDSNDFYMIKGLDIVVDVKHIKHYIENHGVRVIAIDSLAASIGKKNYNEMNPEVMTALYHLQSIAQHYGVLIIITHHKNKRPAEKNDREDAQKQIGGFGGIVRANDGYAFMSHSKEEGEEGIINFDFQPRSGEPHSMKLKRVEGEALFWDFEVESESSLSAENIKAQNKILRILREKYEEWQEAAADEPTPPVHGVSLLRLTSALDVNEKTIVSRLNYMLRTQAIDMDVMRMSGKDTYIYHYPADGECWLQKYLDREEEEQERKAELDRLDRDKIQEFMNCSDRAELIAALKNCNKSDNDRIGKKMNEEEYQYFWLTLYPATYSIRSWVKVSGFDDYSQIERVEYPKAAKDIDNPKSCHKYFLTGTFANQEFREWQIEQIDLPAIEGEPTEPTDDEEL